MHIFIQGLSLHSLEVQNETVSVIKEFIEKVEGIPVNEQVLYHAGIPLYEDQIIAHCVPDHGTVDASATLKGGKVHGSLARAGKVKGQTPKVEKQEKKKKKTGRAKRRMQFNRRFTNAVVTFGRKKGPNSNS